MNKSGLRREHITGISLSRAIRPSAVALAVAACFSSGALANPTNPTVVHGTASFNQAGNILNITNSHNAIIHWGSFSIGLNELTRFIQPSALSAVLNRVTGQDPSAILGALQSNGRVFLLNPNGIVFGAGAQIDVAGLVASTLNLSNDDFLNNRMRFTDGAGAGSIVNQGQITGGSVYLVGNAVTNHGLITSPNGEVVLAAGHSVELVNPGTPNLRVEITAPENEARNLGTITAEAGRIGIHAGLIHNSGTLNASSAVAEGGRILLKAKKDITLASTSVIDASGQGGGEIIAFADNNMYVDGVLKASAPVSGDGGFIETSGKNRVKVADSVAISTSAVNGRTGTWLIDPNDFVIDAYGGDMTGTAIGSQLAGTNVVITSTMGSGSYGSSNGDILVNDGISWSSGNSLTLTAIRNVEVNQAIQYTGIGGGLNLNAGWDGVSSSANPVLVPTVGDVVVNAPITVNSNIKMAAGNDIRIFNSVIATGRSVSYGGSASITLTGRSVLIDAMVRAQGQEGGPFDPVPGGNANIAITAGAGGVTVYGSLVAEGGVGGAYGGAAGVGGNAGIQVNSSGNVAVHGWVDAVGGNGNSGNGGNASIQLASSNGGISIIDGGEVYAHGGYGGSFAGGSALVKLNAAQGILVDGSEGYYSLVEARGGDGETGGNAAVELISTGSSGAITVSNGGEIYASGGSGSSSGYGGSASVKLNSAQGILIDDSSAEAYGGYGNTGGTAVVELVNTGSSSAITVSSGAGVYAAGGDGPEGGFGGAALTTMNSAGSIAVNGGASVEARGGEIYMGFEGSVGGAATVSLLAGGNIQVEGAEGGIAQGGEGYTGGDAAVLVVAGGNVNLSDAYMPYAPNFGASGGYGYGASGLSSIVLSAAGDVILSNGGLRTDGVLGLGGQNIILMNGSSAHGGTGVSVSALGMLSMNESSLGSSYGNAYINTGGNVNLDDYSTIYGSPDVFMNVGGVININNDSAVEAGSPHTINLTFPLLTSGGFFVNGIEGVVFDGNTGFFANGVGAVLGDTLKVTYGGGGALAIPTEALIVAMGQSTKPPDSERDRDIFEDINDEKTKDAPVCR